MSRVSRASLRLSSSDGLNDLAKQPCPSCRRNRMFFCYDCRILMDGVRSPSVTLPCAVDIVKHKKEKNGKSTAIHCKIVAPDQTRVFDAPDGLEDYGDGRAEEGWTVLVFPSPSAVSIEEFVHSRGPIKRIVVIDCTWFQVGVMQKLPEIKSLPCVSLRKYSTAFWRPQHNLDDGHLATIEAIYYALREYQEISSAKKYESDFDDLLFWFFVMYEKVENHKEEKKRKREMREEEERTEKETEKRERVEV